MPDDKSKVGEPDRSPVAADQDHEVSHLAETSSRRMDWTSSFSRKLGERLLTKPNRSAGFERPRNHSCDRRTERASASAAPFLLAPSVVA